MRKTLFYAACSVAISLTFFMGLHSIAGKDPSFWVMLVGVNLALWSSWPAYRSQLARQATMALTLVVLANPVVSLLMETLPQGSSEGPQARPHMTPDTVLRMRMIDGALPGLSGVHRFSVDGHGFRTNGPIDYAHKPAGVLRVVGIGASTMEEGFIDDRKTWTNLVAERLARDTGRKVEMINTAFSGLRAEHDFGIFVESEAYHPDVALFLMGINDWNHAILEHFKADHPPPRRSGLRSALGLLSFDRTLLYRGIEIVRIAAMSQADRWGIEPPVVDEDGAEVRAHNDSLQRPTKVDFRPEAVDSNYALWVGRIMSECRRRQVRCIFIDQPTAYHAAITADLRKRLWMTPLNADYTLPLEDMIHIARLYNDWLGKTAAAQGFSFCSISPYVPPTTDYFFDDCHYNDNGSRTVARLVGDCLADLKL